MLRGAIHIQGVTLSLTLNSSSKTCKKLRVAERVRTEAESPQPHVELAERVARTCSRRPTGKRADRRSVRDAQQCVCTQGLPFWAAPPKKRKSLKQRRAEVDCLRFDNEEIF